MKDGRDPETLGMQIKTLIRKANLTACEAADLMDERLPIVSVTPFLSVSPTTNGAAATLGSDAQGTPPPCS